MRQCAGAAAVLVAAVLTTSQWASAATTIPEDAFNVTINTDPAPNGSPISNAYFGRVYLDDNALPAVQTQAITDIARGTNGILIGLLLPAVQKVREAARPATTVVAMCDGSVLVAMGDGSVRTYVGDSTFDFKTGFGMDEAVVMTALQQGDMPTLNSFLSGLYTQGLLLPAVQKNQASTGGLVTFSTPAQVGTISVTETPEPASLGLLGVGGLALLRRRRGA